MSTRQTVLMIGGSDAGKTNFLFRFWMAIRDRKKQSLMPNGVPPEAEYLNRGAEQLLSGNFAKRTPQGTNETCEIPVLVNGESGAIVMPDRPGEEWSRIYRERRFPADWKPFITDKTGCLVFLRAHSDANQSPLDWFSIQQYFGNAANLEGQVQQEASGPPTQVALVDWIQMLVRLLKGEAGQSFRPRIGIIISAWDLLSPAEQAGVPFAFIQREFPLLADFLLSNQKDLNIEIFGVSLLGGDPVQDVAFRTECMNSDDPCAGGYVVFERNGLQEKRFDLTLPVAWALGLTVDT